MDESGNNDIWGALWRVEGGIEGANMVRDPLNTVLTHICNDVMV